MKDHRLRLRLFLGAVCALTLVTATLVVNQSDAQLTRAEDCIEECAAVLDVPGLGTFDAELNGSLSARQADRPQTLKSGQRLVPVEVMGSVMRGYVDGLGETMMWLDKSRPVAGSALKSKQPGTTFPATQDMRFHVLMTVEALPGRTFRSISPFHVRSGNVNSLPPQNAVFTLAEVVELEDVEQPGEVAVRMVRGRAVINAPQRNVDRPRWQG